MFVTAMICHSFCRYVIIRNIHFASTTTWVSESTESSHPYSEGWTEGAREGSQMQQHPQFSSFFSEVRNHMVQEPKPHNSFIKVWYFDRSCSFLTYLRKGTKKKTAGKDKI